jgi:hypothetical protein
VLSLEVRSILKQVETDGHHEDSSVLAALPAILFARYE